jgi:hypothetical protein
MVYRCPRARSRWLISIAVTSEQDMTMSIARPIPAAPSDPADADLLKRVRPDPRRPGPDRWRVVDGDLPVWALIQHIMAEGNTADPTQATEEVIVQTAADYRIPEIGVRAAIAYYAANRCAIETRLANNDDLTART